MKRNTSYSMSEHQQPISLKKRICFHEAGHAAAIILNNKARQLPSVIFQISFCNIQKKQKEWAYSKRKFDEDHVANIKGGRLIKSLSPRLEMNKTLEPALEADIINIFSGPLAEAKYIHQLDDEYFSERLVNINALNFYGGQLDLAMINEYLEVLCPDKAQQETKMHQLFSSAFDFVNQDHNWKKISRLANHLFHNQKKLVPFSEIKSAMARKTTQHPAAAYP